MLYIMQPCHHRTLNSWNFKRHGTEARVSQNNQIKMSLKKEKQASIGLSSRRFRRVKKNQCSHETAKRMAD